MNAPQPTRPWYCRDRFVDEYKSTLREDDEKLPMLKTLKILRAIIVNVGIFGIGAYAMYRGGDPTLLAVSTLAVAGAYNGLELGDYLALVQAYNEIQTESDTDD
ncbi:hypothetical protein [Halorubrum sp. AS12]|uniref:hypothetical protein n=1 Tax=Halorubrum sp. AS12 TaxID=3409687 RepID=UPI003DA6F705